MKKKYFFKFLVVIMICCAIIVGIRISHEKKELATKKELEHLYYRQNTALGLCCDYGKRNYYHDAKELDVNELAIRVSAYNFIVSNAQVTVDEIVDYLSSEFDSEGRPRIYSQPENIEKYIIWYIRRANVIDSYRIDFSFYLHDSGYKPYKEMSYEEVETHLEEFQKNPEYNSLIEE